MNEEKKKMWLDEVDLAISFAALHRIQTAVAANVGKIHDSFYLFASFFALNSRARRCI